LPRDLTTSVKADAIARLLLPDQGHAEQLTAATEVAEAQLELVRIREVRAKLMAEMELRLANPEQLRRLAALDRYERLAAARRRRAAHEL
jgi:hypothetical protein